MAEINVTDQAAKIIDTLIDTAQEEKAHIADALTTAVENMQGHIDQDEYLNICAVLGRYNRLISVLS